LTDPGPWLIGIVLAMLGIGMSMYYQAKILLKPDENKKTAKQLSVYGKIFISLAGIYLIVYLIFWQIIPCIVSQ